ncbi:MAG: hypothetical protein OXJ52_09800 [Oligoflexia bacterium]|nr:hypothetical protein [Oligoflexia bacterium]
MIIDSDKHPEQNLFFIGARLIECIKKSKKLEIEIEILLEDYNNHYKKISIDYLLLGLDWLYILGFIDINEKGNICI